MSSSEKNDSRTSTPSVRCIKDKNGFYDLMSYEKPNDCSHTIKEQIATELSIKSAYEEFMFEFEKDREVLSLYRDKHIRFLFKGIRHLPSSFECLDASRPWICYWILHALYLLDATLNDDLIDKIATFLNTCQNESGGFGGGPDQISHLATTYAAVNALCILNKDKALKLIRRDALLKWMRSLKLSNGAFRMHTDGEEDLRGTYCAITVALLCGLDKLDPNMFEGTAEWIVSCQTYEGGFGATPFNEAHGGYSFCALAALKLLGKEKLCNLDSLTRWLVNKQMKFEGGFQGRTNKLVDSCYSFWQAGMFPIIHSILVKDSEYLKDPNNSLFDRANLEEYILICCQLVNGGIIDKPGKNRDYYHTCYALSGLSIAQNYTGQVVNICEQEEDLLRETHPVFNIGPDVVFNAFKYFSSQQKIQELDKLD